MIYRDYQDKKLSLMGMGCMRLPVIDGDDERIDEKHATEMIDLAMENGINYYDTAWGYHGGHSEEVVGRALAKYPRDNFYLADKFPGYDLGNFGKVEEIFEKQLEKCGVDYFDFYLCHNVCELNIEKYLDESNGTLDYLKKQKENGRIRHLGFSAHGSIDVVNRFLEKYGEYMEFCQIQLNYLDWEFQDARLKVEKLKECGIPVWVMEPLRGGRLCRLTDEEKAVFRQSRPDVTDTEWAFRYLQSIPGVTMILAGSSSLDQMKENLGYFAEEKPLSDEEMDRTYELAKTMTSSNTVPCTACHYCMEYCPQGLNIPELLALYNEHSFTEGGFIAPMALGAVPKDKRPSACIGCGSCEAVCPQQIKISEAMADFTEKLK